MRGKGPVILVVDDDDEARETIRDLLEYEGYQVVVAANGRDALACLDALDGAACIVLLDLFMPVMNGWDFVERIRADGRATHVNIVITTSAPQQSPAGFAVLPKPLDPEKLLATIESHC